MPPPWGTVQRAVMVIKGGGVAAALRGAGYPIFSTIAFPNSDVDTLVAPSI